MKPNFDSAKDLPRIDFFPCRRRIRGRFDKPEKFLPWSFNSRGCF